MITVEVSEHSPIFYGLLRAIGIEKEGSVMLSNPGEIPMVDISLVGDGSFDCYKIAANGELNYKNKTMYLKVKLTELHPKMGSGND